MVQNEMKAMRGMPVRVRLSEGLGVGSRCRTAPPRLLPRSAVARLSMLMPNDNNSNLAAEFSIHDRVRKDPQRKDSSASCRGRPQAWMLDQEIGHTLKFAVEALSDDWRCVLCVEVQCVSNVLFRTRVKRITHRGSLARRRAIASLPGTAATAPESSSASRRSASRSQASSTSGSGSRLAMRRSRRCDRSAGVSFRASASKASRLVLMAISGATSPDIP